MWILDHRRDVEVDMRAIFRLSPGEAYALPAHEFFALAYRLPAYSGVLGAKVAARVPEGSSDSYQPGRDSSSAVREVPATRRAILADPDLSAVVSFGSAA